MAGERPRARARDRAALKMHLLFVQLREMPRNDVFRPWAVYSQKASPS